MQSQEPSEKENDQEYWFSITEYSLVKNISISTIRRRIRSNKIKYKETDGKYFISDHQNDLENVSGNYLKEVLRENRYLKERVRLQGQEIEDLKMLVKIYEDNGVLKQ